MSTNKASSSTAPMDGVRDCDFGKASFIALILGVAGIVLTAIGFVAYSADRVGFSWLISIIFWLSIALGMLFMVMLHHIFDAGWSTILRRPLEHGLATFPWLALLFAPLVLISLFYDDGGLIWHWMASDTPPISGDLLYLKKESYLNNTFFIIRAVAFFGLWIWLSWAFRRASFSQDRDGDPKWTSVCRKLAAAGLFLGGLSLTFAAVDWIKSLDHHWFSTMFGVWYFAGAMRAAFAALVIICVLLAKYGPLKGLFKQSHLYEIGRLMLAFTIFWAYISFSQYFLILNANIPEETFWYVVREQGNWWNVGLVILFCGFFAPFLYLLFYKSKLNTTSMILLSCWLLVFHLVEMYFYILPSQLEDWVPVYNFPVFDVALLWDLTALIGVGGICTWAFLRSFRTQRVVPLRDPRILESINHHG